MMNDVGVRLGSGFVTGAQALSNQRCGSHAKGHARRKSQAADVDANLMRGINLRSQTSHQPGEEHQAAMNDKLLAGRRKANLKNPAEDVPVKAKFELKLHAQGGLAPGEQHT